MALEFRRQDLRGVGYFWSDTPSLGDGRCFLGLGRLLGVGIAYVTSFENFASFFVWRWSSKLHISPQRCVFISCGGGIREWR